MFLWRDDSSNLICRLMCRWSSWHFIPPSTPVSPETFLTLIPKLPPMHVTYPL